MADAVDVPTGLQGLEFVTLLHANDMVQDALVILQVVDRETGNYYPVVTFTENTSSITLDGLARQYEDYRENYRALVSDMGDDD